MNCNCYSNIVMYIRKKIKTNLYYDYTTHLSLSECTSLK